LSDSSAIHDRRQHAHVIAGNPVHTGAGEPGAAEDVASANDDRDFDTALPCGRNFAGDSLDGPRLDPVIQFAHQSLAAQLEQYATVRNLGVTHIHAFSLSLPEPPPGDRRF
jgi:hypothetical protein